MYRVYLPTILLLLPVFVAAQQLNLNENPYPPAKGVREDRDRPADGMEVMISVRY
jgi:hypothetical protein